MDHIWIPHHEWKDNLLYNVVCKNCRVLGIRRNDTWPRRPGRPEPAGAGDCALNIARHVMES